MGLLSILARIPCVAAPGGLLEPCNSASKREKDTQFLSSVDVPPLNTLRQAKELSGKHGNSLDNVYANEWVRTVEKIGREFDAEMLTPGVPYTAEEIEAAMAGKR